MTREFDTNEFHILQDSLTGRNLIEASAGTGKTFTIENLYLRLLLEKEVDVQNILVVTFTEAATAELRERIRANLSQAFHDIEAWRKVQSEEGFQHYSDWKQQQSGKSRLSIPDQILDRNLMAFDPELIRQKLRRAIINFDEAAIFTIHGFCSRMLHENAFESSILFETELIEDESRLLQEVVDDFWRSHFYEESPLIVELARRKGITPENFDRLAREIIQHPDIQLIPAQISGIMGASADIRTELNRLKTQLQEQVIALRDAAELVRCLWPPQKEALRQALFRQDVLNKRSYKPEKFDHYGRLLEDDLRRFPFQDEAKGLKQFSTQKIELAYTAKAKKAGLAKPEHPFFSDCQRLLDLKPSFNEEWDRFIIGLKLRFREFLISEDRLGQRKKLYQVQSFNDLLLDLRRALRFDNGQPDREGRLAQSIRQKYRVAMIDEFQDTDPVQYEIFDTIFHHQSSLLFMIGDPKQSIYAFRGADIFAYMEAAAGSDLRKSTLSENFRSNRDLLTAFNAIFESEYPFVYDSIGYPTARSGHGADEVRLVIEGEAPDSPPLKFWWLPGEAKKPLSKGAARKWVYEAVVATISRLLNLAREKKAAFVDVAKGEQRPVKPEDIAVLVTKNDQAFAMQECLNQAGIPAVIQSSRSVFQSEEANHLYHILRAILEPANDRLIKTALATPPLNLDAERIRRYQEDEGSLPEYEFWLELFQYYQREWKRQGFIRMFSLFLLPVQILLTRLDDGDGSEWQDKKGRWLARITAEPSLDKDIRQNLLGQPQGERRLTNLLHLMEILHQAAVELRLGPNGLIAWLQQRLALVEEESNAYELRLERDENSVKILTVHKSKGLQFPIVFCPFTWDKGFWPHFSPTDFICHTPPEENEGGHAQLLLDIGSPLRDKNLLEQRRENLAEAVRFLYVALTRAKYRGYLAWGRINKTADSALMYLRKNPDFSQVKERQDYLGKLDNSWTEEAINLICPPSAEIAGAIQTDRVRCWEAIPEIGLEIPRLGLELYRSPVEAVTLAARVMTGRVPSEWGLMSYSLLAAHGPASRVASERQDDPVGPDAPVRSGEIPSDAPPFARFPGGRITGDCVHEIFEEVDFCRVQGAAWPIRESAHLCQDEVIADLIGAKLEKFGRIEGSRGSAHYQRSLAERSAALADMLYNVLNTPLASRAGQAVCLSQIDRAHHLSELEFYYPINEKIEASALNRLVRELGLLPLRREFPSEVGRLEIRLKGGDSPRLGFMHGIIDLIFEHDGRYFIADWKTNFLGYLPEQYHQAALITSMIESGYVLQYYLYTLALDRYLATRLPNYDYERYFGGVFYLYVRGMDGVSAERGVFCDRPEKKLVTALARMFFGGTDHD
jgi:exodeoxyribonuclease V beta subunit